MPKLTVNKVMEKAGTPDMRVAVSKYGPWTDDQVKAAEKRGWRFAHAKEPGVRGPKYASWCFAVWLPPGADEGTRGLTFQLTARDSRFWEPGNERPDVAFHYPLLEMPVEALAHAAKLGPEAFDKVAPEWSIGGPLARAYIETLGAKKPAASKRQPAARQPATTKTADKDEA